MKLNRAIKVLQKALREDEELYYGYQSNIAMALLDEFDYAVKTQQIKKPTNNQLHAIANQAAKRFLDIFRKVGK